MRVGPGMTRDEPRHRTGRPPRRRVAVMLVNGRGDYLMSLPTLRALSACDDDLVLVTGRGAARSLLGEIETVDVIELPHVKDAGGPRFDGRALAARIGRCDRFVSLNPWHNESMCALLPALGETPTLGYDRDFDISIALDFSRHSMDLMFDAARHVAGVDAGALEDWAWPPRFDRERVRAAAEMAALLPDDCTVLGIQGDTLIEKRWSVLGFESLVTWFLSGAPDRHVLDFGLIASVGPDIAAHERFVHCGELVLPTAFELVRRVDAFVGVDSCFLHAADLWRVPGVGLFGATDVHEFGFRLGGPAIHLRGDPVSTIPPAAVIRATARILTTPTDARVPAPCPAGVHA